MHETDNRTTCYDCGDYLQDGEFIHEIVYSSWEAQSNDFASDEPQREKYCEECWDDIRPSNKGTQFEVDTVDELWNILSASNGKLVVDCKSHFVGGRPYLRVLNGDVQEAVINRRQVGDGTLGLSTEFEQRDRQDFEELIESIINGDLPPIVRLRNSENTPFADLKDTDSGQENISNF